MKRVSLSLFILPALLLSQRIFADLNTVSVIPQQEGLFVGVTGFYAQPEITNGILNYASENNNINSNFVSDVNSVSFGNNWNEVFTLGYTFPDSANDIEVTYLTLKNSDQASTVANTITPNVSLDLINNSVGNLQTFGPATFTSANSSAKISLDQVNAVLGQYLQVANLGIHPTIGLGYGQVNVQQNSNSSGTFPADVSLGFASPLLPVAPITIPITESSYNKSDFAGIGPVVGMDLSYNLSHHFAAVSHLNSGIYAGYDNTNFNYTVVTQPGVFSHGNANIAPFSGTVESSHEVFRLAEQLSFELGANYTYILPNHSQFTLEGGYYFSDYFNAIDKIVPADAAKLTVKGALSQEFQEQLSLTPATPAIKTANFNFYGPYISLVFHA